MDYVLTRKDHGQNVFCEFRFGLIVNTFKFMINYELESSISDMPGMTLVKFYFKNSCVDPYHPL